ncbi:LytTR family transcriptional regulator DNA-binding domain-containing protein [Flagellimonas abyssi]|uniref:LytTR family transcriptional regulator DNA-binding domain-containing protein n=1 Tax=Flagellimonas abyssi TaxID=2864871 RepID=UPI00215C3B9E|nr:LytTR family transcriptional regulator DNA-binding domain-containing protein [Allomuricauda abyssi]
MEKLPDNQFLRAHRSFVVNIAYITASSATRSSSGTFESPSERVTRKHALNDWV